MPVAVACIPGASPCPLPGVAPPPPGPGTCDWCHGPARPGRRRCWCCRTVAGALGRPSPPVVPLLLYQPGDRAHAVLRGYKDAADARTRAHLSARLAATLQWFLTGHRQCLAQALGPVDAVCVVPGRPRRTPAADGRTGPAAGDAPLPLALRLVPALARLPRLPLATGAGTVCHIAAAADAFVAPSGVAGARVLLLDDTWTTGAHACSAAAALTGAGGTVAGIVVLGRSVNPQASPVVAAWWRRAVRLALAAPGGPLAAGPGSGRGRGVAVGARPEDRPLPDAGCALASCPRRIGLPMRPGPR